MTMHVGFIGLGTMGASMALNLQKAGHQLVVNDIRHDAGAAHVKGGAKWAETASDVGMKCELVFTSLPGPREVEAVADELIKSMPSGAAWFELSTNSPTVIRKLHAQFTTRNISLLDAPVSGGPRGANSGKLAIWVG